MVAGGQVEVDSLGLLQECPSLAAAGSAVVEGSGLLERVEAVRSAAAEEVGMAVVLVEASAEAVVPVGGLCRSIGLEHWSRQDPSVAELGRQHMLIAAAARIGY